MSSHPIVVIGAGLSGSAAAWKLSAAGRDVVVLERDEPASPFGSSHGSARIFRYAYPDPFYTDLVRIARAGWDELEASLGTTLITPSGALDFGGRRDPAALASVLGELDIAHELLAPSEAADRWPGFAFDGPVLWHEAAGVIDAESAVNGMLRLAEAHGAVVHSNWTANSVLKRGDGYVVVSETGAEQPASQVVVAAGGWLPSLLGSLDLPDDIVFPAVEVRQEQALHFPYRDPEAAWPTFIHKTDDLQVYGLPGGRDADFCGQKVAIYNGGRVIPSALGHDRVVDPAQRERLVDYVARTLPGLNPEPYAETTCLFTNLPEEEFVIDRVEGVTILSPCSGHGAKFAPLIGELAARLVTGGDDVPARFRPLHAKVPA
ncbi:FAD-dependent oxidoreductase [Microbacterium sp. B2969]|uniref:FAD-dependent oxidoreductase n=1 Tax=Microbacterium alkaliflavum TaxID=3248839 RepID=A0ABW7QBW3_9MICO